MNVSIIPFLKPKYFSFPPASLQHFLSHTTASSTFSSSGLLPALICFVFLQKEEKHILPACRGMHLDWGTEEHLSLRGMSIASRPAALVIGAKLTASVVLYSFRLTIAQACSTKLLLKSPSKFPSLFLGEGKQIIT